MAIGDKDRVRANGTGGFSDSYKLQDAATAINSGAWVEAPGLKNKSLHVIGPGGTFTAQLMGSNAAQKPADATDGPQIGSDITSESLAEIAVTARWYKLKITACSGATVTGILHGTGN